jgi:hypothetical protein
MGAAREAATLRPTARSLRSSNQGVSGVLPGRRKDRRTRRMLAQTAMAGAAFQRPGGLAAVRRVAAYLK